MSATIFGVAYRSACDINAALASPGVMMNGYSYDGRRLFEECLRRGGFTKVDQTDDSQNAAMIWGSDRHNLFVVEYDGKRYQAFLECHDVETAPDQWESVPECLALLMDSSLENDYGEEFEQKQMPF